MPNTNLTQPSSGVSQKTNYKKFPSKQERDVMREMLNTIDIKLVLIELGAEDNQDGDSSKWKIPGVGNIIHKGQGWKNVNTEKKGYGGVGLVQMALNHDYQSQSMAWLIEKFGDSISDDIKAIANENTGPTYFTPPDSDLKTIDYVVNYLIHERCLPPSLIHKLVKEGKIYSDEKKNCVFISTEAAEIRSTSGPSFKGCCLGSQTETSGFSVMYEKAPHEKTIGLVEAAVDSLSYRTLFPGRFSMSTNGSGRFMLQYRVAAEAINNGFDIKLAFDADWAGDFAAQKIFNAFYVRNFLEEEMDIDPDLIDEWFLTQKITFEIDNSEHEMFFNKEWKPSLQVSTSHIECIHNVNHTVWTPTDVSAAPQIRIKIQKNLHPKLLSGEKRFVVSQKDFDYITQDIGIVRERPKFSKDWNDELKRLGSSFIQSYEHCAANSFKTVPQLPPYLAELSSKYPTYAAPDLIGNPHIKNPSIELNSIPSVQKKVVDHPNRFIRKKKQ